MRLAPLHSILAAALLLAPAMASAQGSKNGPGGAAATNQASGVEQVYGPQLEGFEYPFPTADFTLTSQRQSLTMGYMDIRPEQPNGRSIVLLHGKNFCGASWEQTIGALRDAGWRVVVPDQIGFCRSSKPDGYQFSLHQLAANTHALLTELGIRRAVVMGHSMGGMLAARYALMYPEETEGLVMVNPIGLEDWEAAGVPHQTVDQWFTAEQRTSPDSIRAYQRATYYAGTWEPRYERWVQMQAGMYAGPGRDRVLWNQAQASDMIFTQPVLYQFPTIRVPTLLLSGDKDNTAIGKAAAPRDLQPKLGDYPALAPRAAEAIPNSKLVRFEDLGHSPQIQDPERFHRTLLQELKALR
ncbi:alpha/beta fold hydrolase [Pseudoroseomonas globiformis]|uniref:Alpha/beta fold hydrolase n=1 Tax=Teichococcus globiformis TaxID=2307229 RepID=A0ABV7FY58_9PROT